MSSCCYVITGHCPVHRLSVCPLAPLLKVKGGRNEELRGGEYSLNMSLTTVFPLQAVHTSGSSQSQGGWARRVVARPVLAWVGPSRRVPLEQVIDIVTRVTSQRLWPVQSVWALKFQCCHVTSGRQRKLFKLFRHTYTTQRNLPLKSSFKTPFLIELLHYCRSFSMAKSIRVKPESIQILNLKYLAKSEKQFEGYTQRQWIHYKRAYHKNTGTNVEKCRVSNKYFVQTEDLKENVGKHKNTEHDAETLVSWSA